MTNHRRRRALEILADAGQRGCADPLFIARFTQELLDLVRDGQATAERVIMRNRGRTVEVARITITDAGRTVVEGPVRHTWH